MAVSLWIQNFESEKQPPFTTVGFVIQVLLQRKTENCASLESVQSSKIEKQQLIWLTYIIIILTPVLLFKKEHFVHCSLIIISLYHYSIYSWLLFSYKNSLLWSTIINFIKDLTTFLFSTLVVPRCVTVSVCDLFSNFKENHSYWYSKKANLDWISPIAWWPA